MRIPIDCSLKDKEQQWIESSLIYDDSELAFYAAEMNPSIPLNEFTVFTDHAVFVSLVIQKADFSSCAQSLQEPPVSDELKIQEEILNYIYHRLWADRKATVTDRNAKIKKVKRYGKGTHGDVVTLTSGPLHADIATYHISMLVKGGADIDFTTKVVGDDKKCNSDADPLKKKDVTPATDKQKTKSTEQKSSLAKQVLIAYMAL